MHFWIPRLVANSCTIKCINHKDIFAYFDFLHQFEPVNLAIAVFLSHTLFKNNKQTNIFFKILELLHSYIWRWRLYDGNCINVIKESQTVLLHVIFLSCALECLWITNDCFFSLSILFNSHRYLRCGILIWLGLSPSSFKLVTSRPRFVSRGNILNKPFGIKFNLLNCFLFNIAYIVEEKMDRLAV